MGDRGPAQTPKKELEARGSWLAKDRADDLVLPGLNANDPPGELCAAAKAEWARIVGIFPAGVLTDGDRGGMMIYCRAFSEENRISALIDAADAGSKQWASLIRSRAVVRMDLKHTMKVFGLTPADRTRVKMPDKPKSDSSRFFGSGNVIGKVGA